MCHSVIDTGFIVNSNVMYNYPKIQLPDGKFIHQLPCTFATLLNKTKILEEHKQSWRKERFFSSNIFFRNVSYDQKNKDNPILLMILSPVRIYWSATRSALHNSASENVKILLNIKHLANSMKQKGNDDVNELLNMLKPIVEKTFNTRLKTSVQHKINII